jgi:aspartyl-tRNA(Asn)/glutamyl-tRNA(Gln) amidotransferase subunit B
MKWETVIGLEVHAQLQTKSKLFSGASIAYGASPNTQACAIDLGLPGVLPVLNKAVIAMSIKLGLALNAEINQHSVFARKNYFYPDLPKGYQISQFDQPIIGKGTLPIQLDEETTKIICITRAHLEEDAGKSMHDQFSDKTAIDLNRAGTPLLEIVSEPDMRSAKEAVCYLKTLHTLVRYLEICDGNMQEGSFRCDANVSVRPLGSTELGTRTEIKNVNSFRFVERAIEFERDRQIEVIENGGEIRQETRLYDANTNETRSMRSKEDAHDYRYFPCPDLMPAVFDQAYIDEVKKSMPELPSEKKQRLMEAFSLSAYDANILVHDQPLADFFEKVCATLGVTHAKLAANWIIGELLGALNKENMPLSQSPVDATQFAELLSKIIDKTISGKIAKTVFEALWQQEGSVDHIIKSQGLEQVSDAGAIEKIIEAVIANNPNQHAQYLSGKDKLFGFFVGQVMKESKGKANPEQVNQLLKDKLQEKQES